MNEETIGAYAFVTKDWRKLHYPLDLWLEHHLNIFDQISLCVYGDATIVLPPKYRNNRKIKITSVKVYPNRAKFNFYVYGKTIAQRKLQTDWKVLLDIDEFLVTEIKTETLDKRLAYPLIYHNLYKNLEYELVSTDFVRKVMTFVYANKFIPNATLERIHFGNRLILGDGGLVSTPYYVNRSLFTKSMFYLLKNNKHFSNFIQSYIVNTDIPKRTSNSFHVVHTTFLRPLAILRRKLIEQIQREINEKVYFHQQYLIELLKKPDIDIKELYKNYKLLFPETKLIKIDKGIIPNILLKNKKRFEIVKS